MSLYEEITEQCKQAVLELLDKTTLTKGNIVVIGCSTSEVAGEKIGTGGSSEVAKAVFEGLYPTLKAKGIFLAAQCCEHLNRAIITERDAVPFAEAVMVVPKPHAGGSFAAYAYTQFQNPVAIEEIKADAGLDIGGTLIGMQLKRVAVPMRLTVKQIGSAPLTAAYTRPKYIGGPRAQYE